MSPRLHTQLPSPIFWWHPISRMEGKRKKFIFCPTPSLLSRSPLSWRQFLWVNFFNSGIDIFLLLLLRTPAPSMKLRAKNQAWMICKTQESHGKFSFISRIFLTKFSSEYLWIYELLEVRKKEETFGSLFWHFSLSFFMTSCASGGEN